MIQPSEEPSGLNPVALPGAFSLFWRALETLALRHRRTVGVAGLLVLPACVGVGALEAIALAPFFKVVDALVHDPFSLLETLDDLQYRSILIYAGLYNLGLWVVYRLVASLVKLVVIAEVSASWVGEETSVEDMLLRAIPLLRPYFRAWLLREALLALGLVILLLPGMIAYMLYSQVELVVLLEGRTGTDALRRSSRLMERWDTLYRYSGMLLYLTVLAWLVDWGVETVWSLLLGSPGSFFSLLLQDGLSLTLLLPVEALASVIFYTDLRTRQRAFDDALSRFMQTERSTLPVVKDEVSRLAED